MTLGSVRQTPMKTATMKMAEGASAKGTKVETRKTEESTARKYVIVALRPSLRESTSCSGMLSSAPRIAKMYVIVRWAGVLSIFMQFW